MPATPLGIGAAALFRAAGHDSTETDRPITGTAVTDNPTVAYVAKVPSTTNQYCVKVRPSAPVPAGTAVPVNITINGIDDRGNPLPVFVEPFIVNGPALPPPATHIAIVEGPIVVDSAYAAPADPGSDTIPL